MGGINSLGGLNNVSVDFRPAYGTDVQNAGNANLPQPGADAPRMDAQPVKTQAKSLVRELDVLLLNAAERSVSADSVKKNVKDTVKTLVDKGVLTEKEASTLTRLASDAAGKLRALDKFSGRDLAKALMTDQKTGETVWSAGRIGLSSAAKAVKSAIEAQQTLSDELGKFIDRLAKSDKVDFALQDAFTELQFQCDRRASEIDSVLYRMYDLAQKDVVEGANSDPQIKALLNAKFKELMPREAIMMHGTAEAFERLNTTLAAKMRPLAEKLDAFAADSTKVLTKEEIATLRSDMATMKNALADVRANGIEIVQTGADGTVHRSRTEVDRSLLDAMGKVLDSAERHLKDANAEAVRRERIAFVSDIQTLLSPEKTMGVGGLLTSGPGMANPGLSMFMNERGDFVSTLRDFAIGKLPMSSFDEKIDKFIARFKSGVFSNIDGPQQSAGYEANVARQIAKTLSGLRLVKAQFKEMMETTQKRLDEKADIGIATGDVRRIMLGELGLSNIIEAKIRGFKPGDVDPAADSSNIVASKELGAGQAGKTYLLETKSGKELVFKPELDSRIGLDKLLLGIDGSYADKQTTVNLNLATQDAAKAFGCEDVVVKYSVGSHDGQFGFFMEKADGCSGLGFTLKKTSAGGNGIAPADMHKIPFSDEEKAKIQGSIAQKLNRLRWLDLITGQGDRHWDNYFVNVDKDTREVTVKGIDNDASFGSWQIGLQKYSLNKERVASFTTELKSVCGKIHGFLSSEYKNRVSTDPAITRNPDGTMTIDLAKAKSPEIKMAIIQTFGVQSVSLPEEIDKDFHDRLMEMDSNPAKKQEFLESLRPRISAKALEAAEKRLNDAIAYAKTLDQKGKVYGEAEWKDRNNLSLMPENKTKVQIEKSNGKTVEVDNNVKVVRAFLERDNPSLFMRDGFHKMFDPPKQA